MSENLNLFLIENKSKIKSKEDTTKKLLSVKHTLKSCLDYIIENESIEEQDDIFLREELLNLLKSYMNINIQLNKKNEKTKIVRELIDNLIDNVIFMSNNSNNSNLDKEIIILKKERTKIYDKISVIKK
jgi:galactose-1-phosphate uridylyltransferase